MVQAVSGLGWRKSLPDTLTFFALVFFLAAKQGARCPGSLLVAPKEPTDVLFAGRRGAMALLIAIVSKGAVMVLAVLESPAAVREVNVLVACRCFALPMPCTELRHGLVTRRHRLEACCKSACMFFASVKSTIANLEAVGLDASMLEAVLGVETCILDLLLILAAILDTSVCVCVSLKLYCVARSTYDLCTKVLFWSCLSAWEYCRI
jgi:hypothetical protein